MGVCSVSGSLATTIGVVNPVRYRGYYYDTESGLYYLMSRYYDAQTGRFLNADTPEMLAYAGSSRLSSNLYVYCDNNPCNRIDQNGYSPRWVHLAKGIYNISLGIYTIMKLYRTGFVRTVLSAVLTRTLILLCGTSIGLLNLQQYIPLISTIISIIAIVNTVKKLTANIPYGLWHLKQSIWHTH